jgi:16S rRNA (uracil1498-N3)-methyltransferase
VSSGDTTFFYAPPEAFASTTVELPPDEAHHAIRVLRLKPGHQIQVVDGIGGWYNVQIESAGGDSVAGQILQRRMGVGEPPVYIHLAVAGLRSRSRFDLLVEKVTELGVSRISVLNTERSEHFRMERERAHRLMRAAMKQCKRSRLPVLDGPVEVKEFVTSSGPTRKIVCHGDYRSRSIAESLRSSYRDVVLAVGPEAGFSDSELQLMISNGFERAGLGSRRLRTETAAIAAVAVTSINYDSNL